jgi:hypothetical protein
MPGSGLLSAINTGGELFSVTLAHGSSSQNTRARMTIQEFKLNQYRIPAFLEIQPQVWYAAS